MRRARTGVLLTGIVLASVGIALGAGALRETIASPRSLPTDSMPPFGMLDDSGKLVPLPDPKSLAAIAAPMAAGERGKSKLAPPVQLSLDLATEALRAALSTCSQMGLPIAAAVVDPEGRPVVMMADVGTGGSVFVAMRKAATALGYREPSSKVGSTIIADSKMLSRMTPVMFISGGALPIWRGKELIGAIASSGAHGEGPIGTQDEICAKAGLDRIAARIR